MRISANLADLPGPREKYALAWTVPGALAGLALLALLVSGSIRGFIEYKKLHSNLIFLQNQEAELRQHEAALRKDLDQPQRRQVFQKAKYVNDLISRKELTLTELTEEVSKLMPDSVRLISMSVTPTKEGTIVRFAAEGHTEQDLEAFLGNVDDSPLFKDLNVSGQGYQKDVGAIVGQVGISCTARYVGSEAKPGVE